MVGGKNRDTRRIRFKRDRSVRAVSREKVLFQVSLKLACLARVTNASLVLYINSMENILISQLLNFDTFCMYMYTLKINLNLFLTGGDCHLTIKRFGPRSGLTERRSWLGSKLFDTLIVFLKDGFLLKKKVYFKNKSAF